MFNLSFNSHGLKTFPTGRFLRRRKLLGVKTGGGSGCRGLLHPSIVSAETPGRRRESKRGARTPWVPPSFFHSSPCKEWRGDGGRCEPTCGISSSTWSRCSHPKWLNAPFNSFLNIPCPAIGWQRICCMTAGKFYKILTSVSLPRLEQSQWCPPALSCAHKSK